jgi:hypothetical protein
VHEEPMVDARKGKRAWPLVRGVVALVEALKLGSRRLRSRRVTRRTSRQAVRLSVRAEAFIGRPGRTALVRLGLVRELLAVRAELRRARQSGDR